MVSFIFIFALGVGLGRLAVAAGFVLVFSCSCVSYSDRSFKLTMFPGSAENVEKLLSWRRFPTAFGKRSAFTREESARAGRRPSNYRFRGSKSIPP